MTPTRLLGPEEFFDGIGGKGEPSWPNPNATRGKFDMVCARPRDKEGRNKNASPGSKSEKGKKKESTRKEKRRRVLFAQQGFISPAMSRQ